MPRVRGPLVTRDRLHQILDSALDGPWALVTAPAGCGKSSLLLTWMATLADRELTIVPSGDLALHLRDDAAERPFDPSADRRRVLVIDHAQPLSKASWRRLAEFTQHDRHTTLVVATRVDPPLPLARLAITGDLVEIRAHDLRWTESEVRALLSNAGLHLNRGAIDLLVSRTAGWSAGLKLAIAGMSRADDPHEFLRRFGEDDHATIEYLSQEVLGSLTPQLRDLLTATAGTPDLTPASAVAVSGQADASLQLDRLVDEGLLCTADGSGIDRRYRYHPLLLAMLRRGVSSPGRVARERAAHWHAAHARPAAALFEASVSGAHDLTARLVLEHGPALLNAANGRAALRQAYSSLSPSWRDDYPYLLPLAGWLGPLEGEATAASHILTDAEDRRDDSWPAAARYDLLALRAWAAGRGWRDPARSMAEAVRELGVGTGGSLPSVGVDLARESMVLGQLGILSTWHGDLQHAAVYLEAATRSGRVAFPRPSAVLDSETQVGALTRQAMAYQALVLVARGQPRTAASLAEKTLASDDDSGLASSSTATAHIAAAWAARLRGLPVDAQLHLARAAAGTQDEVEPLHVVLGALLRADLLLVADGPAAAQTVMEPVAELIPNAPLWVRVQWAYTQLRLSSLIGGSEESLAALRRLVPGGAEMAAISAAVAFRAGDPIAVRHHIAPVLTGELPTTVPWVRLAGSLIDAAAAHVLGDRDDAARGVVRTLVLGAPEELVQPFAEVPRDIPGLLALLDAYPQAAANAGAVQYIELLRSRLPQLVQPDLRSTIAQASTNGVGSSTGQAGQSRRHRAPALRQAQNRPSIAPDPARLAAVETLTARELEVLSMLDSVMPMSVIASRLYVTVNTLKTHVGAIYRKFGVDSRADAVERAYEVGVLTPRR